MKVSKFSALVGMLGALCLSSCGKGNDTGLSQSSGDDSSYSSPESQISGSASSESTQSVSSSMDEFYTIVWKNWDGTVLETDLNVSKGSTPTYDGELPAKSANAQYSYSFIGWSPSVVTVCCDAVYTAQFSSAINGYTVIWKNWDGSVLETDNNVPYGTMPTYDGATPAKDGDSQRSFFWNGWSPSVDVVSHDAQYTATFSEAINTYTVTWENWDGTVLEIDSNVPYGSDPSYDGETPTKSKNDQYSYSFKGWSPDLNKVTSNVTYTALFEDLTNTYTVTWENWDGSVLEIDSNVPYGSVPAYDSTNPEKPSDAQYSYSFEGWSPKISEVHGDITYTAQFADNTQCYTIVWKNWDGTVLETDLNVPYGTMPSYDGSLPSKGSTVQYSYAFTGWSPDVVSVIGDAVYVAQFGQDINGYKITWKNYDGSVLETDEDVPYGALPSYDGTTPLKKSNAQYTYTFTGWSPAVVTVTGNAEYTATFSDSINGYTITWVNYDGTVLEKDFNVLYGAGPSYDGETPTRDGSAQFTYSFSGWSPSIASVTGDATYMAQYNNSLNSYTVVWKNWEGTVLETDLDVPYGTTPTYDSSAPVKDNTDQYSYTFEGWSPEISSVEGNAVYVARFAQTTNKYKVEFRDYDSTILFSTYVDYGTDASFLGNTPTRPDASHKHYVFKGWSGTTDNIKCDTTVTAEYSVYDVYKFIFANGTDTSVQIPEGDDASGSFPKNSDMVSSINTETSYSWASDGEYQYKEVGSSREFYHVTYNLNGGTNSASNPSKIYSDESYALYNASRKGYIFEGWYADQSFTNKVSEIESSSENICLYARYSLIFYKITYHLYGSKNAAKNPDSYTIEDTISLKEPSKVGYTFNGWFTDELFTQNISNISACTGNLELYAKFTPNSYSCSFRDGTTLTLKAEGYEDITLYLPYGQAVDPYSQEIMGNYLSDSKNSAYSSDDPNFSGWYYDSNYTNAVNGDFSLNQDTTLYSHFHKYSSTTANNMFDGTNCKSYANALADDYYRVPTLSDGILKITFWFNCSKSYTSGKTINTTYYAGDCTFYNVTQNRKLEYKYWSSSKYCSDRSFTGTYHVNPGDVICCSGGGQGHDWETYVCVTYEVNGRRSATATSNKVTTQSVLYDDIIANPEHHSKRGYDFAGWTDSNGNLVSGTNWTYLENQNFAPAYTVKYYNINYHLDCGSNSSNNPRCYTVEDSFDLSAPYKQGYSFVGWHLGSSGGPIVTNISDSIGTLDLFAEFQINTYSLTIDGSGGSYAPKIRFVSNGETIHTEYLHEGQNVAAYYPNGRSGYRFAGWYTDSSLQNPFDFNGNICDDLTLYAKWVEYSGLSVNIDEDTSIDLSINGKTEQLIVFTPISDGQIDVVSISDLDLVGSLLDEDKKSLISSDDISDDNLNFSLTYEVKTGKTYYFAVKGNTVSTIGDCELSFSFSGDSTINGITYTTRTFAITYGDYFYLPDSVEREGFTFKGWFDEEGNKYDGGQWCYTFNLTLHAEWEPIE